MAFNKNLPVLGARWASSWDYHYFAERTITGWEWKGSALQTLDPGLSGWGYKVGSKYLRAPSFYSIDDGETWAIQYGGNDNRKRWACDSPYADKGKIIVLGTAPVLPNLYGRGVTQLGYKNPYAYAKKYHVFPAEVDANGLWASEVGTDGTIHLLCPSALGATTTIHYWRSEDFGITWTSSPTITLPSAGSASHPLVHGVGDDVAIVFLPQHTVSTYPAGIYIYSDNYPGSEWECSVELFYCPSSICCYVSHDAGATWETHITPLDAYGSYFTPSVFRYTILTGPYAGTRWNWDYTPTAGAAPLVLGIGSVGSTLYVMAQKYEIAKTIAGGPYLFPTPGHGDPPTGPTYINRLLCFSSSGWSGDLAVVDALDMSAGWVGDLQMRTSADGSACYGVALRSGFWEVFANGTPHLVSFGGPTTCTYNMNYPVIIKEPAGYSFWW